MGLQVLWSMGLACLDVYALRIKRDLHNPVLVSLFVVGDWVLSLPLCVCEALSRERVPVTRLLFLSALYEKSQVRLSWNDLLWTESSVTRAL